MEIMEVIQLKHKIKKIYLKNSNFYSTLNYITQKIVLEDVSDSEVVRFSLEPKSNFLQHEVIEGTDEYYVVIPNNLNSTTTIYAHYLPAQLYEYDSTGTVVSYFDFKDMMDENPVSHYFGGEPYTITQNKPGYDNKIGEDGSFYVQSVFSNNKHKDPNYKNFINSDVFEDKNVTEKGMFPLSSRFRPPYRYFDEEPKLDIYQTWNTTDVSEEIDKDIGNQKPYWEARIHKKGLSPLIADTEDREYSPIKVQLNYQYLPSSTDHHQHYYGFEGECPDKDDIYVLDGDNINKVNPKFGPDDNYRIIPRTNPFDTSATMFVDHTWESPVVLSQFSYKDYITQNKCYKYYTYNDIGFGTPTMVRRDLDGGELYSLKYFVFIPDSVGSGYDCCLSINGETISQEFLDYDKELRNEWIYHEIPFIAEENANVIKIHGPNVNSGLHFFLTQIYIKKFIKYAPELNYTKYGLFVSEKNNQISKNPKKKENETEWEPLGDRPANVWETKNELPRPKGNIIFTLGHDVSFDYDSSSTTFYYSHPANYEYVLEYDKDEQNPYNLYSTNSGETRLLWTQEQSEELYATFPRNVMFYKGPNNSFTLYLNDAVFEGNPITNGTVEIDLVRTRDLVGDAVLNLGIRDVQKNGMVYYNKIDFSNVELINNEPTKYYFRIKYIDPCTSEEPIYELIQIYIELPNIKITPLVNGNYKNKRFIPYDENGNPQYDRSCDAYLEAEYYPDDEGEASQSELDAYETRDSDIAHGDEKIGNKYIGKWAHYKILNKEYFDGTTNVKGNYYVYDIEKEFPLKIEAEVYNETSGGRQNRLESGYCEISVDDKIVQTTIVDVNGKADFYIDFDDIENRRRTTIKIVYYDRYWETIDYIYFDLIICEESISIRESVPIIFREIDFCPKNVNDEDNLKDCGIQYLNDFDVFLPQDDMMIFDIDNTTHRNNNSYNLSVYRHKESYKNINKFTDENSILIGSYDLYNNAPHSCFVGATLKDCDDSWYEKAQDDVTTPMNSAYIKTLQNTIEAQGRAPHSNIGDTFLKTDIVNEFGKITKYSEAMCELLLYAPILYKNLSKVQLHDFWNKNEKEKIVYYSFVTNSIKGYTTVRPFKRTVALHYMNYIKAYNYEIVCQTSPDTLHNPTKFYEATQDGFWRFKGPIQIKLKRDIQNAFEEAKEQGRTVENEIDYVQNAIIETIQKGRIELYMNGELLHNLTIENGQCIVPDIKRKNNEDNVQLRYVFKDGYHYVSTD